MHTYTNDRCAEMANAIHRVYGTYLAIELETAVYTCMELNSPGYDGGSWAFVTNDNHTLGFWYPTGQDTYAARCENYFSAPAMDAKSIGAACTLVALNQMVWALHDSGNQQATVHLSNQFYALRDWIFDLAEADQLDGMAIAGFID